MDGHINLKAYQAHETHSDFPDDSSVVNYFKEKLNTCNVLVDFIRNNVVGKGWNGNVAEIGSGNSKLLYRLDSENLLSSGYGIEVSESRHKLAERYKRISKNTNVHNINSDIMRVNPYNNLDLIIGVDTVFQLVAPMFESAEEKLLKWTYQSLHTGGVAIFDFRDFSKDYLRYIEVHGNNEARIWHEFSDYDKYKYEFEYVYLDKGKLFLERKYFKRHTFEESVSTVEFMLYTPKQLEALFDKIGFQNIKIIPDWFNESAGGISPCFLVYATK